MGPGGRELIWVLLASLAAANPTLEEPLSTDVAAGMDIGAWREIQARRLEGDDAIVAWQDFVARYPASPLAESAWARLVALGAAEATLAAHPELETWRPWWERSHQAHAETLARHPQSIAVADLAPDGTPRTPRGPRWLVGVSAGGGYDGGAPFGGIGFRVERGIFGVVGRAGWSDGAWSLAGFRVGVPSTVGVGPDLRPLAGFGEVNVRTDGRIGLFGGGRLVLTPRWWLEATLGVSMRRMRFGPAGAVEVVFGI